jgi:hypothetical protein
LIFWFTKRRRPVSDIGSIPVAGGRSTVAHGENYFSVGNSFEARAAQEGVNDPSACYNRWKRHLAPRMSARSPSDHHFNSTLVMLPCQGKTEIHP